MVNYASLGASLVFSLFLTPIVLRHTGAADYGLWITIISAGGYLGLLDTGVSTAAVREVAICRAREDEQRLAELFGTLRLFFFGTALVALALAGLVVPFLSDLLSLPRGSVVAAQLSVLLMGVGTALGFLKSVPAAALYGGGRSDVLAILGMLTALTTQGAQIGAVLLGGGIVSIFAASAVGSALGLVLSVIAARRTGMQPKSTRSGSSKMMKHLLRGGSRNMISGLGGSISYELDAVIIAAVLPIAKVAPYDLALSTSNLARSVATTGTNLLLPTYAHADALEDSHRQFRLYSRAMLASMALTGSFVIALLAFGQDLLQVWLGAVPKDTFVVLVVLNLVYLLQLPGHQSFVYLTSVGRNKLLAQLSLPIGIANVALSVAATVWLGPVGPAVGSLPQVALLDFLILPLMCCRAMNVDYSLYWKRSILPLILPFTAAGATAALLRTTARGSIYLSIPEAIAVVLVACSVLVAVLYRTDADSRTAMRRLGRWPSSLRKPGRRVAASGRSDT
ncbi:MAG: oligosaccharide flippase family protein [Acidobacteriota bacterium]|nr:oligosaccharide flippase family protein [Acidobacteriota bacterium]